MKTASATALAFTIALQGYAFAADAKKASTDAKKESADAAKGECHGVNSCKGTGECGGSDGSSCAGTNSCKGKGWITLTKAECAKRKGKFSAEPTHKS